MKEKFSLKVSPAPLVPVQGAVHLTSLRLLHEKWGLHQQRGQGLLQSLRSDSSDLGTEEEKGLHVRLGEGRNPRG